MVTDGNTSKYGYGSIPINTIFRGMNIHLPAILMFTRGTRFWHTAIYLYDFVSEISRQATAFLYNSPSFVATLPLAWPQSLQTGRCISEPKWSLIYLHSFSQKGAWDGLVVLFWCLSPKILEILKRGDEMRWSSDVSRDDDCSVLLCKDNFQHHLSI